MTRICRQDVLRYLGIHARQLRAWEQANLIEKAESYSLEDYGRLRTLRDLGGARIRASRISASVHAMQSVSGMTNVLLDAGVLRSGPHVLFRHRGLLTEPIARQFVFDFEPAQSGSSALAPRNYATEPLQLGAAHCEAQVSAMFLEAVQTEDAANPKAAAELYERILQIDPSHAPACINLGTICYNLRLFSRAEQLYRRATESDPGYALAFFDLGNVLDEMHRLTEAIEAYRTAIRLVPNYADAHYNLALAYERTGERRRALRHWTAYLKLDRSSNWANHARGQARKILEREKLAIVHRSGRTNGSKTRRTTWPAPPRLKTV